MNQLNQKPCALCNQLKPLRESHFMPRAIYKRLRDESRKNPNPMHISATEGRAITSSKQLQAHLLCDDCESRFDENGEKSVMASCYQENGSFPLREILEKQTPKKVIDTWSVHQSSDTKDQFIYFATSIFWRSATHQWMVDGKKITSIILGDQYQEEFREYLMGEKGFPSHAFITMYVSKNDPHFINLMFPPATEKRIQDRWYRRHSFYIPGLLFDLFVGKKIPLDVQECSLNGGQSIILYPIEDLPTFKNVEKSLRESERVQ